MKSGEPKIINLPKKTSEVKEVDCPKQRPSSSPNKPLANAGLQKSNLENKLPGEIGKNPQECEELLTEKAAARRLAKKKGHILRHKTGLGFLMFDGTRWKPSNKAAERLVMELGDNIREEVSKLKFTKHHEAKNFLSHAKRVDSAAGINAILDIVKSTLPVDGDETHWDSNPLLLNCPNGTFNFRIGTLQPHDKEDYITKVVPFDYNPNAECSRWLSFLDKIFEGDKKLVEYIRWVLCYCLTGLTKYHIFFILWGNGANGKSTLINIIQHILGNNFSQQMNPELLMEQKFTSHLSPIARLRGIRFVAATETNMCKELNAARIKAFTGGDKITANFMRENTFEFVPEFKLFLCTNFKPYISDFSEGFWRRVRLIPFERNFMGKKCDPNLEEVLKSEAEGILAWILKSSEMVLSKEPVLPEKVKAAKKTYQSDMDLLDDFISQKCTGDNSSAYISKREFFVEYQKFTEDDWTTQKSLSPRMQDRGFKEIKNDIGRCWAGIALKNGKSK